MYANIMENLGQTLLSDAEHQLRNSSTKDCDYCGELVKEGHLVHNWKKRFFILRDHDLRYFARAQRDKEGDSVGIDLRGEIPLLGATIEPIAIAGKDYAFSITNTRNQKDFRIMAPNLSELREWVRHLTMAADVTRSQEMLLLTKLRKGMDPEDVHKVVALLGTRRDDSKFQQEALITLSIRLEVLGFAMRAINMNVIQHVLTMLHDHRRVAEAALVALGQLVHCDADARKKAVEHGVLNEICTLLLSRGEPPVLCAALKLLQSVIALHKEFTQQASNLGAGRLVAQLLQKHAKSSEVAICAQGALALMKEPGGF